MFSHRFCIPTEIKEEAAFAYDFVCVLVVTERIPRKSLLGFMGPNSKN